MHWQEDPESEDENVYAKVRGRGKTGCRRGQSETSRPMSKRTFSDWRLVPCTRSSKILNIGLFSTFFVLISLV